MYRASTIALAVAEVCHGYTQRQPSMSVLAYLRGGGAMLTVAVRMPGTNR